MLKAVIDNLDEVPSELHQYYLLQGTQYILQVQGMKTGEDVSRVQTALASEREVSRGLRERLALLGDRKIEDVLTSLDRIPELEALAAGKVEGAKLDELVEARLRARIAPVERERDLLRSSLADKDKTIEGFTAKDRTRTIQDAVRQAAVAAKILPEALEDAIILAERTLEIDDTGRVVTRDGVGLTPGIDPSAWFSDLAAKKPHWWGSSFGGGAPGGKNNTSLGDNPWTAEHWNVTKQGLMVRDDATKADRMAKAAGVAIGATKPAVKN